MTQLTKFTHSCIRLDDGERRLVLDPGVFSEVPAALDGVDAVLITHEHPDHLDVDSLQAAAARNPRLRIWAPQSVADTLADLGEQVVPVAPGQVLEAGGFNVRTLGGQHAVIHATIPVVANVGYLIDDAVYHPGDALIVPVDPLQVLLAPVHAPWSKTSEVIDFVVAVRAPRAIGVHDSLLTRTGLALTEGHLKRIGGDHGVQYTALASGETLDV